MCSFTFDLCGKLGGLFEEKVVNKRANLL